MATEHLTSLRDAELPDLVVSVVTDMRELFEAHADALRTDLGERLTELGATIRSWLVALCVAIVTLVILGLALASTLVAAGLPGFIALWSVTGAAICAVVALVFRARRSGRKLKGLREPAK